MLASLFSFYQRWVLQRPVLALATVLILAVLLALGLPRFKLDASSESLTLENDTSLEYYRQVIERYGSSDFLVVTYTPKTGDLFDDANLAKLDALRKDLSAITGVESVTSILDVPLLYSPKVSVAELQEEARTLLSQGVDKQLAKQEFLNSPVYEKQILSPDGQTTGMLATLALDTRYLELVRQRNALRAKQLDGTATADELAELEQVSQVFLEYRTQAAARDAKRVADVRALLDNYRGDAEIFLGGASMVTADMIDFIRSDLVVFGIGILLFIIATLALIFRELRWVILPLVTCALSVLMMLGYLSWIDWRLTVISSNFVSLLLIITLALTIHLIVRYRELQAEMPQADQMQLVSETVRLMIKPCVYTVLTTIVAFVSLVVSNIRPVIDFGWMMTIGIIVALVLAFIIIPAGMMLFGNRQTREHKDNSAAFTLIFSRFTEKHRITILLVAFAMALISAWGVSQLKVDNRFIDYFRADTEIYQGMKVIDRALGGTMPMDIIIQAPTFETPVFLEEDDPFADANNEYDTGYGDDDAFAEDAFAEADPFAENDPFAEDDPFADESGKTQTEQAPSVSYWFSATGMKDLQKIQDYLDGQSEIGKVSSLLQVYQIASDLTGHKLNDFEIAFMRKSLSDDIKQLLVSPYWDKNTDEVRISLRAMETQGVLNRNQLIANIDQYLTEEVGIKAEDVQYTGLLVLYNNMLQSLFTSQILTLGAVFVGIMVMFLVLFRSLVVSIVAIVPNLLAAAIVLGGMGLFQIPLDMMTITIAAITVGIGVDHAIHYIHRFKTEYAVDGNYIASMHRAHGSIGQALFYTAITIIVGFSILALSNFIPSVYFGLLTGLAMTAALLGSMTLLPALLVWLKPFKSQAS